LGGNKKSIRTDGSFEKVRFEKNNKTVFFHNHTPKSKPKQHDVTRGGDGGQACEPGHDGPCCSVGLLPMIINNDNLFYLSLVATAHTKAFSVTQKQIQRRINMVLK
jgi:hypothetical protein